MQQCKRYHQKVPAAEHRASHLIDKLLNGSESPYRAYPATVVTAVVVLVTTIAEAL